jgi:uncharacterized phage-associated protein
MAYDGRAIANFILDFCDAHGRAVTNLSLQKLVFFCHAWSLIELGKPLIRQKFEAWQFGPVLQYLYRDFKTFDSSPINVRAKRLDPNRGHLETVAYGFDSETESLLRAVLDFYSRLSAGALVSLTHVKDGPWDRVWNHPGKLNPGMTIDENAIEEYYSRVTPPFGKTRDLDG